MKFSIRTRIGVLLFLITPGFALAGPKPQKYAPLVGRWRIELSIEGSKQVLEFQTDGEGVYGLGTGYFVLSPADGRGREYPAAWRNTDPQRINITGEIKFTANEKLKSGTLLLRTVLQPGQGIKGDLLFIDEQLTIHRGTFTMNVLLGPEQILEKKGTDK
jgi:hypothetical protein